MARSRANSPGALNGVVAWMALGVALLALIIALSDQPWLTKGMSRLTANYSLVQQGVRRSLESPPQTAATREAADEVSAPEQTLRRASRAARAGDLDEMRSRLEKAAQELRTRARALRGEAREECRALAVEIDELQVTLEGGLEAARSLSAMADRAEDLLALGDSDSAEQEASGRPASGANR